MKEIDIDKIKQARLFPPAFRPTQKTIDKLVKIYDVHPQLKKNPPEENPDPADCQWCGLKYKDLRTGLDFQAVKDMLWVAVSDSAKWRHKGRSSVLGLWYEIKRNMWADHLAACRDQDAQIEWVDKFGEESFEPVDYDDWDASLEAPF